MGRTNHNRSDSLKQLAELADIAPRRRAAFVRDIREALGHHKGAVDGLDRNRLREAAPAFRALAKSVATVITRYDGAARAAGVRELESLLSSAIGPWDEHVSGGTQRPRPTVRDVLVWLDLEAQVLVRDASRPGRPTAHATTAIIGLLLEVHDRHKGIRRRSFVREAMASIGVVVTDRKIRDVIAAHVADGRLTDDE